MKLLLGYGSPQAILTLKRAPRVRLGMRAGHGMEAL